MEDVLCAVSVPVHLNNLDDSRDVRSLHGSYKVMKLPLQFLKASEKSQDSLFESFPKSLKFNQT